MASGKMLTILVAGFGLLRNIYRKSSIHWKLWELSSLVGVQGDVEAQIVLPPSGCVCSKEKTFWLRMEYYTI